MKPRYLVDVYLDDGPRLGATNDVELLDSGIAEAWPGDDLVGDASDADTGVNDVLKGTSIGAGTASAVGKLFLRARSPAQGDGLATGDITITEGDGSDNPTGNYVMMSMGPYGFSYGFDYADGTQQIYQTLDDAVPESGKFTAIQIYLAYTDHIYKGGVGHITVALRLNGVITPLSVSISTADAVSASYFSSDPVDQEVNDLAGYVSALSPVVSVDVPVVAGTDHVGLLVRGYTDNLEQEAVFWYNDYIAVSLVFEDLFGDVSVIRIGNADVYT